MSSPIISEDTIALINKRNTRLVSPPANDGTWKISLGLLSPPTSVTSSSSRSTSMSSTESEHVTRYVTVPTHLESASTFEFLGFTSYTAKSLFEGRAAKHADISILKYATDWIQATCGTAQDSSDNWDAVMMQAGINDAIRQSFSKPEYTEVRLVQPLSAWLVDIISTSYLALVDMNARIVQELAPQVPGSRGGGDEPYLVPNTPGGHIALFKSVEYRRYQGCVSQDGSVDLALLESSGPTDFCRRGGLYFTHQPWVAAHYSALITDACPVADRRMVEIHVPLSHFAKVKIWDLKFEDPRYKQLLYHSRCDTTYPKDLAQERARFGVIHGPIAHSHNFAFSRMASWEQITTKHQLQTKDEEGVKIGEQHVWIREDAITQLDEDVRGKVYIRKPAQGFKLVPRPSTMD